MRIVTGAAEMLVLLGASAYGAGQALLCGPISGLRQIHRNFSETFYVFAASVVALSMIDAFGAWSLKGAIAYAVGRASYLVFSVEPARPLRKWAWAVSVAGIVGCVAELIQAGVRLAS